MTHTYPLHLSYVRCPKCHYIFESRKESEETFCPQCKEKFKSPKKRSQLFGPLFGEAPKPEFTWE